MAGSVNIVSSGKLARYVALDPTEPFSLGDWTYVGTGAALTIDGSGRLVIDNGSGGTVWQGALHTAVPARSIAMAQMFARMQNNAPAANDNFGVGLAAEGVGGDLTALMSSKRVGPATGAGQRIDFVNRLSNGASAEAVVFGDDTTVGLGVNLRQTIYVDVSDAAEANRIFQGWSGADLDLKDGQPTLNVLLTTGQACVANFSGNSHDVELTSFFLHADKFVVVNNLPTGYKAQLRSVAEAVLAVAVEAGGVATIDPVAAFVWMEEVTSVVVVDALDSEITRLTPTIGVWGGDVYELVLGGITPPTVTGNPIQATWTRLNSTTFVSASPGTHKATDWELTLDTDPTFATPLASFRTLTGLVTVDFNGLTPSTNYLARARHVDSGDVESGYSANFPFTTLAVNTLLPDGTGIPTLTVNPLQHTWVGLET